MKRSQNLSIKFLISAALLSSLHLQAPEEAATIEAAPTSSNEQLEQSLLKRVARESFFRDQQHRPQNAMRPIAENSASKFVTGSQQIEYLKKVMNNQNPTQTDFDNFSKTSIPAKRLTDSVARYVGEQGRQNFRDLLRTSDSSPYSSPFQESNNAYRERSEQEANIKDQNNRDLLSRLQSLPESEYNNVVDSVYNKMPLIHQARHLLTDNVMEKLESSIKKLTIPQELQPKEKQLFIENFIKKEVASVCKLGSSSTRLPIVQDLAVESLRLEIMRKATAKPKSPNNDSDAGNARAMGPQTINDVGDFMRLQKKFNDGSITQSEQMELNALKRAHNLPEDTRILNPRTMAHQTLEMKEFMNLLEKFNDRSITPEELTRLNQIKRAHDIPITPLS